MARRRHGSLSTPILLSSIAVALSVALLVAWIWVILKNLTLTRQVAQNTWLLVGGVFSFAVIVTVLVLFSVFLAREILEVRRQTSFIDSVTHELRSPLASLRLGLETMARSEVGATQREALREMLLADVERLTSFIGDILEASRVEHGSMGLSFTPVRLRELVEVCIQTVCQRHRVDPAAIEVDLAPGLVLATDPTALGIVVKNILDNAVKYSPPPPRIHVDSEERHGRLILRIRDSGVGIEPRDLKRIFHRFYRVPDEAVRARRGTGLGLFVVAALVRDLGGKVRVSSGGRGRGSTFEVDLPLGAAIAAAGSTVARAQGPA